MKQASVPVAADAVDGAGMLVGDLDRPPGLLAL